MVQSLKPTKFATKPDIRFVSEISGRYTFPDVPEPMVYSCRTTSLSPDEAVVAAPVMGKAGQRVAIKLERIGQLTGHISDVKGSTFRIHLAVERDEVERLAAKINWLKKHSLRQVADKRDGQRFRPRNPDVPLEFAGQRLGGFVIDLSSSGAALSAAVSPPIGTAITVGRVAGRVVRLFEGGFGVQFDVPQAIDSVEAEIAASEPALEA